MKFLSLVCLFGTVAVTAAMSKAARMFMTCEEAPLETLQISGTIPDWLEGSLIRNSPAGYENGKDEIRHWNDGWAQLHKWEISKGTVTHVSKFVNTSSWWGMQVSKTYNERGYGTPVNPGPRDHKPIPPPSYEHGSAEQIILVGNHSDQVQDDSNNNPLLFAVNPMVNVWKFDNRFMTTTDQNLFVEFDPATLETVGKVNEAWSNDAVHKKTQVELGVAHGQYDRHTKMHYWLEIDFGTAVNKAKYNFWTYKEQGDVPIGKQLPAREMLGTVEDPKTSFAHSFGLSANYIMLIQCPMHYLFGKFPTTDYVVDAIKWEPDTNTKFWLMNRQTGAIVRMVETPSFFVYHVLNMHEDGKGNVVVDFAHYANDTLITYGMWLENMIDEPQNYVPTYAQARLTRCVMAIAGDSKPDCYTVVDETFEMATFNWQLKHQQAQQFAYGASMQDPNTPWHPGRSDFIDQLIKVDLNLGKVVAKYYPGKAGTQFVSEPLFATRPGATEEDDGILMTIVFDTATNTSSVAFLDGKTLKEVARAKMTTVYPAAFHGKWCPAGESFCVGL